MVSGRRLTLLLLAFVLLVFGYLYLGFGSSSVSRGASRALDLSPVEAGAPVPGNMAGDNSYGDVPKDELPPESTLGYRDTILSSEGQTLGLWEPSGFFSNSHGSGIRSRVRGPLILTDGALFTVPTGATLNFRYGGGVDFGRNVFDALAFEISDGELTRAEDSETGELRYLDVHPRAKPLSLPVEVPEMSGQKAVRVEMDVPPGVYVVSVSASVAEGNARYNFRVLVGE